jgi:hypothetical protein
MKHPIFDGECHAIPDSEEYAYIAHKVGNDEKEIQKKIEQQIEKFAEYLYENDKDEVISLLTDVFRAQIMCGCTPERYQIIHRPPWVVGALAQYGTIALKFKRSEEDDLDECDD